MSAAVPVAVRLTQADPGATRRFGGLSLGLAIAKQLVEMQDEEGYGFLQGLRRFEQEQGLPAIPAVAVTAFARTEDREDALAAGFNEHLAKPVDPHRLITVLVQQIHGNRQAGGA